MASTGAVDLGTTTLLADTAVGDGVDYTINASGASDRHIWPFRPTTVPWTSRSTAWLMTSRWNVAMNDVRQAIADNDVASSLVVSADGAATVTRLTLDAANDSLVSITGGTTVTVGSVVNDGGNQSVDITLIATANDVTSGSLTAAGGDILVDAGNEIDADNVTTTGTGTVSLGADGAIDAGAVSTAEGALEVTGLGAVTLTSAISTDGNVAVSGDSIMRRPRLRQITTAQ